MIVIMRVRVRGEIKRRDWKVVKRLGDEMMKEFEEKEKDREREEGVGCRV